MIFEGVVTKLRSEFGTPVRYYLGEALLNNYVGKRLTLRSQSEKKCIFCERNVKKTFGQGYCFPCFQRLARCDTCIVRPELCHYHKGTCREPAWGEANCLIEHTVYLAATTSLKIGITRSHQQRTRWIDQGAASAIEIGRIPGRLQSGNIEVELKKKFSDKTNWRDLLTGREGSFDLLEEKNRLQHCFQDLFRRNEGRYSSNVSPEIITYPVEEYLKKAVSINLDKVPDVTGVLKGIRGQYLLLGDGGINVRKYQGYIWQLSEET